MSILGGIQPGPLASYLRAAIKGGNGDDGLMQRFQLMVYPDDPGGWQNVDRWPDTVAKNRAFTIFQKTASLTPLTLGVQVVDGEDVPFLRFTPEAQDLFDQWRTDLEAKLRSKAEPVALEAHFAKYRSLMPTLALLFHLIEVMDGTAEGAVSLRVTQLAAAWCDFLEAHARRIYQLVTHQSLFAAHALAKCIRDKRLSSPFTNRDVYRHEWSGLTEPDDVRAATEILEDLSWLRSERLFTPGRAKLQFHINPQLLPQQEMA
jgi:putative DNA primase/helicase